MILVPAKVQFSVFRDLGFEEIEDGHNTAGPDILQERLFDLVVRQLVLFLFEDAWLLFFRFILILTLTFTFFDQLSDVHFRRLGRRKIPEGWPLVLIDKRVRQVDERPCLEQWILGPQVMVDLG